MLTKKPGPRLKALVKYMRDEIQDDQEAFEELQALAELHENAGFAEKTNYLSELNQRFDMNLPGKFGTVGAVCSLAYQFTQEYF